MPKFNQRLSSIFADIAQVCLATLVIPFFTNQNFANAYLAILMALTSWAVSLKLTLKQK